MSAIHQATVTALKPLSARQDEFENRTFSRLDSFINLVSTLASDAEHAEKPHETTEHTPAAILSHQTEPETNLTKAKNSFPVKSTKNCFYCDICGQREPTKTISSPSCNPVLSHQNQHT